MKMERLTYRHAGTAFVKGRIDDDEVFERLADYKDAEEAGLLARIDERFALAMLAGARAIENNPRKYSGTTFVHDVFGEKPKEISYCEAAKMLRAEAEAALAKDTNVPDKEAEGKDDV